MGFMLLVRDQEVEGSNPFAPTTSSSALLLTCAATACCFSDCETCPDLSSNGCTEVGSAKPRRLRPRMLTERLLSRDNETTGKGRMHSSLFALRPNVGHLCWASPGRWF